MTVRATKDLKLWKGSTKLHAFECDDGRTYLVKFMDRTRSVVNEYVGYSVARYLQLPVPPSAFVVVSRDLIDGSDELRRREIGEGVHHGSLLLEKSVEMMPTFDAPLTLVNGACLPGVIVLDNLLHNRDRSNWGNNLLRTTSTGAQEYVIVDFNEILAGPRWTTETLHAVRGTLEAVPTLGVLRLSVTGMSSFSPWLEAAEGIAPETLSGMLSGLPADWDVDEAERRGISEFILTRKGLVRGILRGERQEFPNWR